MPIGYDHFWNYLPCSCCHCALSVHSHFIPSYPISVFDLEWLPVEEPTLLRYKVLCHVLLDTVSGSNFSHPMQVALARPSPVLKHFKVAVLCTTGTGVYWNLAEEH